MEDNKDSYKLYTTGEFAERINVSKSTIRNWVLKGHLVPIVAGEKGYSLFSEEQAKYIDEKRRISILKHSQQANQLNQANQPNQNNQSNQINQINQPKNMTEVADVKTTGSVNKFDIQSITTISDIIKNNDKTSSSKPKEQPLVMKHPMFKNLKDELKNPPTPDKLPDADLPEMQTVPVSKLSPATEEGRKRINDKIDKVDKTLPQILEPDKLSPYEVFNNIVSDRKDKLFDRFSIYAIDKNDDANKIIEKLSKMLVQESIILSKHKYLEAIAVKKAVSLYVNVVEQKNPGFFTKYKPLEQLKLIDVVNILRGYINLLNHKLVDKTLDYDKLYKEFTKVNSQNINKNKENIEQHKEIDSLKLEIEKLTSEVAKLKHEKSLDNNELRKEYNSLNRKYLELEQENNKLSEDNTTLKKLVAVQNKTTSYKRKSASSTSPVTTPVSTPVSTPVTTTRSLSSYNDITDADLEAYLREV
jgi:DNA-binding transcriptional MerR regulator